MSVQTHTTDNSARVVVETREDRLDPRRADVLFRKRRAEGQHIHPAWLIGSFVAVSATVVALMSLVPGGTI